MTTQYTDRVITGMQALFGDGYLSPGGAREMTELFEGLDIAGSRVLDIGCGLGGAAVALVGEFGAAHVTGIDVAPDLLRHARARAETKGLSRHIAFEAVEPGPFRFDDDAFDVVFTKDVFCHVEDKAAQFREIARVLKPGGRLILADFVAGPPRQSHGGIYETWLARSRAWGLSFLFEPEEVYTGACKAAGLVDVTARDHTTPAAAAALREVAWLTGPEAAPLHEALGEEKFEARIGSSMWRHAALVCEALRHIHLFARKG
jgi:SAM-dependent methyltransferase